MKAQYPGYDVMRKRDGPSWNAATRTVIDERLALPALPLFFNAQEWLTVRALSACVLPQPDNRPAIPIAAMVDAKLFSGQSNGYLDTRLPPPPEAWRRGLAAIDAQAHSSFGVAFEEATREQQLMLITAIAEGSVTGQAWDGLPSALLFRARLMHDLASAYYSHPAAWSEIGFGGPASPRGYVRLGADRRDAWEAVEAGTGQEVQVIEVNHRVR